MVTTPADEYVTACHHLSESVAALARDASVLEAELLAYVEEHSLSRSVLVVDDCPAALAALVAILSPIGVPVHAVTTDAGETLRSTLAFSGAVVHVVDSFADAARVWRNVRSAVVVSDLLLGRGVSGFDVLEGIGRGPHCVVVTSCEPTGPSGLARRLGERLSDAAATVQAEGIVRTGTGSWEVRLRDGVLRALDVSVPAEFDA